MTSTTRLSDICDDVSYGFTASATDMDTGTRFLRITDIQGGKVDWETVPFCEIDSKSKEKNLLRENDIVVARTGNSTGENYLFSSTDSAVFASYLIRFRVDPTAANPKFVWYQMRSKRWWNFISGAKTGSAQAGANAKVLGSFEVNLPAAADQKAIAHILGTLDDKIELNQKMNQTLEEIAKAIFKSWFVDFDPVRAKAEGRPTGLPPEISDLFPHELVDSEIGEIPTGWRISTFADVLEIQGGFAFKSKDFGNDGDPVIKIKNIRGDGTVDQFNCDRVANVDKKLDRFLLRDGDAVIAMTGATVGKVGLMSVIDEKFYLNQRVGRLVSRSSSERCWYSVLLLSSEKTKDYIEGYAYGSAQPNISSKDIGSIPNVKPPSELLECFNEIASPLFKRTLSILKENDLLSELRDTLLPKLISGELRIPDAEKFLEEAGI